MKEIIYFIFILFFEYGVIISFRGIGPEAQRGGVWGGLGGGP